MKYAVLSFVAFLITLSSCSSHSPLNADSLKSYTGYTGEYEGFTLVYDDRFNGFNNDLWKKGDGGVGHETHCRFQQQGVQVVDGILELVVRKEHIQSSWSNDHKLLKDDYEFSCGEVRTTPEKKVLYGRIETRMKTPARESGTGYISSLFTYNNTSATGTREWEEIDIELEGIRPDKFQANLIYGKDTWEWWRTRAYGAWEDKITVGPVDEWRVFAIEWVPDAIRWYVDGVLVKTLAQSDIDCKPECVSPQEHATPIPDNPTSIYMNFWIPNDIIQDSFGGNKGGNIYPMKTQYDWFRYYQLDSHPVAE